MRHLWFIFAPLILLGGIAVAQVTVQTRPGDGGVLWFDTNSQAILPGHIVSTGAAPVVSACGAGATIIGSDLAGTVTTGAATTTCTITFNKAFTAAPTCVLGWPAANLASEAWSTTTTAITVTQTSAAGNPISYICIGKQ